MIAAKAMDPVMGVDIHIVQPPGPVPPIPVPHPFIGMLIDPMDFAPIIGATVMVNGMPRATAGTGGQAVPPHIPIGGVFVKPTGNECEVFMGSATVLADGDPLSLLGMPALSCHDVGMPPPPRLKKKRKPKSLALPTSVVLAIPGGAPVVVGGPPTISMMALGMKVGMAGLGKAFKKLSKTKLGKKIRKKFKRKAKAQNTSCGKPGEPIDQVTGEVLNEFVDFAHGDSPAFVWTRFYSSGWRDRAGPLGFGFRHGWQRELRLTKAGARYVAPDGKEYEFQREPGTGDYAPDAGYTLRPLDDDNLVLRHPREGEMRFQRTERCGAEFSLRMVRQDGCRSELDYDERRRLLWIRLVSSRGRADVHLRYDELGRISGVRWQPDAGDWQEVVAYAYDASGCLSGCWDSRRNMSAYHYDDARAMVRLIDRNGFEFFYRYDDEGRCVGSGGEDGVWGVALRYETGHTVVTEADGGLWDYFFDELGTIRRIVDPHGGVRERHTDEAGRVVEVVDPDGLSTHWIYDGAGFHTTRLDSFGNHLRPEDDEPDPPNPLAHRVAATPAAREWGALLTRYDRGGELRMPPEYAPVLRDVEVGRDSAQARSGGENDAGDQIAATRYTNGRPAHHVYDPEGCLTGYRDRDGREFSYRRSSWRSRGSEIDPLGNETIFEYTHREQIRRVVDAGGNESRYLRDEKDRVAAVIRHGVVRETYTYDVGDRLIEKRTGAGRALLTFRVGENGLHASRGLASGGKHSFAYDEWGNFTEASTDEAKVLLSFDRRRRPLLDQRDGLGVEHGYDPTGLARTLFFGNFPVRYHRTLDGRVAIRAPAGGQQRIRLLGNGYVLKELGNGTRELSAYAGEGRCSRRIRWTERNPEERRWTEYEYSAEGELRREVCDGEVEREWRYDAAHRLTSEWRRGREEWRIAVDAAGNIVSLPARGLVRIAEGNRLAACGLERFIYDERNHLAEWVRPDGRSTRYTYDSLDMLVRVSEAGAPDCTLEYDGLCRRTAKIVGGKRTEYYWDDDRLAAEIGPDGSVRLYVYVDERALIPLMFIDYESREAEPESGRAFFVFHDQVGLPVLIQDAGGSTVWRAQHVDPYGAIVVAPGSELSYHLRFPGHYLDSETDLHCNRFRYYSPSLRRYLQSDPLGQSGGINLYAYPSNPLVEVDVLGLHAKKAEPKSSGKGNAKKGPESESPPTPGRKATTDAPPAPEVSARFDVNGKSYSDVNPTARPPDQRTGEAIDGLSGVNNSTSKAHAEVGAMNQALKDGNRGGSGVLEVQGQDACGFCQGDVKNMARQLELDELTVKDPSGTYKFSNPDELKPVSEGGKSWKNAKVD